MFLNRALLNPRECARHRARAASQPTGTHTHTACPHACVHTRCLAPCTQACTRIYLVVLPVCTHMCALGLGAHAWLHTPLTCTHMHLHKCRTHSCLSTHSCASALTVWTYAQLFYLYHMCATPTCSAYMHLQTVTSISICMHTSMHATCLPACTHTHMHTQPRYPMLPACALPTLEGACVGFSGQQTHCT